MPEDAARKMESRAAVTVDLDAKGKQHGHVCFAKSVDSSAWGQIRLPITVIANGDGPTVLFTGGNHGDEYEGPVAQFKFAQKLAEGDVRGRVIILPCMNYPAVEAGMRTSPLDGGNMNRAFPGHAKGTWTEQIAHFVSTELVSRADAVIDMHSGGKTLDFVPSAVMHALDDHALVEKTRDALTAFGAPVAMILDEDTTGMLDGDVESRGKMFISTELGGRGSVVAARVKIAERGIHNILAHLGVIDGAVEEPETPTRLMDTPGENFVRAETAGIYEPLVDLGEEVAAGLPIGQVWVYDEPQTPPMVYTAPADGLLYARHVPGLIRRGDCMALVAVDAECA